LLAVIVKRRQSNDKTTDKKMKRKANASAKSKEVQPHPQANTRLHHICFCPTAQRHLTCNELFSNETTV